MGSFLDSLVGPEGSLQRHRDGVVSQSAKMDEQIGQMEKAVLASRASLIDSFRAMEKTLSQINQQAAFFTQRFGIS